MVNLPSINTTQWTIEDQNNKIKREFSSLWSLIETEFGFYFLINMAIGGNFGGPSIDNAIFPQQYTIDYIKVYQ